MAKHFLSSSTRSSKPKSKDKILEAARHLFAEKGFHGTATHEIAKTAKVNHSLIFHHFKSKEELWRAVKQSIACLAMPTATLVPPTEHFEDWLNDLMDYYYRFYQENKEIRRILTWQQLEFSGEDNAKKVPYLSDYFKDLSRSFVHYQSRGVIDSSLDAGDITFYVVATLNGMVTVLDSFILSEDQDAYIMFVKERIRASLRADDPRLSLHLSHSDGP